MIFTLTQRGAAKGAVASLSALLVVACAVVQPPSGGPEDKRPPHIVAVAPQPDSASVENDTHVIIRFSEKVNGETFKERVKVYPPIAFKSIKIKGDELQIIFAELLPETTMTILLSGGYRDLHNVESKENYVFHFSTEASMQEGVISGRVLFKEKVDSTGVVKLYQILADSAISFKVQPEARIAFAGRDGAFAFRALPTDSSMFLLWAFSDKNRDGSFAEGKEFFLLYPDTLVLTASRRDIRDISISIIDPNEPGSVTGRIVNETGLEAFPTVRFVPVLPGEPALVVRADSTGHFIAAKVSPGRYVMSAFIDVRDDSLCGSYTLPEDTTIALAEPCLTLPDTINVDPGKEIAIGVVTLEKERP